MNANSNQAQTEAVRQWAMPTTPEDLKRRGVSNLHSVSMSRVANLIEKAVNRTLLARTLDNQADNAESFSTAARNEFMQLLNSQQPARDELVDVEQHAVSAIDQLKSELASRKHEIEREQAAINSVDGVAEAGDDTVREELRALFKKWGGDPANPTTLENEVLEVAVKSLRRERATSQRQRLEIHQRENLQLERRIAKLSQLLEVSEAERKRFEAAAGHFEAGIASEFDSVQGLSSQDALYEKKSMLMTAIFEANLEMRMTTAAG